MIRKHVKTISTLFISALLCGTVSITALAGQATASKEKSGKSELASYRSVLTENRETLGELLDQNKDTMNDIRELQKELKEAGILTDGNRAELASQSAEIQEKRQELREIREEITALRESSRELSDSGDIEAAKEKLEEITKLQEKQIDTRQELTELLETKLSTLRSAQ